MGFELSYDRMAASVTFGRLALLRGVGKVVTETMISQMIV